MKNKVLRAIMLVLTLSMCFGAGVMAKEKDPYYSPEVDGEDDDDNDSSDTDKDKDKDKDKGKDKDKDKNKDKDKDKDKDGKDKDGKEAAFLYNWDGSGTADSDSDLYFKASVNGQTYTFVIEYYLTGADSDAYKAVQNLKVGDIVDMEGFVYWYEGIQPHVTSITVAE